MSQNDLEREPVRGVVGNSGAMPMYYVSKRNSKRPLIFYSRKTKLLAYLFAAFCIVILIYLYGAGAYYALRPMPIPLG